MVCATLMILWSECNIGIMRIFVKVHKGFAKYHAEVNLGDKVRYECFMDSCLNYTPAYPSSENQYLGSSWGLRPSSL